MRSFLFSLTELRTAGLSKIFTTLAVCPKFYKTSSWLAVICVAVFAKKSCNINGEEILTSGDEQKIFEYERKGDLCSVPF